MTTQDEELETFKTGINLSLFAADQGYRLDRRSTSRNSAAMVHPDGDKIILGMAEDRHWVYFSVRNPHHDQGSIIDFVQNRRGFNLGQVRKLLRPWVGLEADPPAAVGGGREKRHSVRATDYVERLDPVARDLIGVRARWEAAQGLEGMEGYHRYLCDARGLTPALLASERFWGRVRIDERGNALFPHWNEDGLCGYEIKNHGFTGFSSGGTKALWGGRKKEHDRRLIVAETAIDALSHASLFPDPQTRYVSVAGQMNPQQPGLLHAAFRRLPTGSDIVLAVDHDQGGDGLIDAITPIHQHVVEAHGRDDLKLLVHRPETANTDWNDVLKTRLESRSDNLPQPS